MHYDSILKTLKYAVAHKVTMYHTGRMYVFQTTLIVTCQRKLETDNKACFVLKSGRGSTG